jgi:hypothetical protein
VSEGGPDLREPLLELATEDDASERVRVLQKIARYL